MATSDGQFVCPLNRFAHHYASVGLPVYAYYFTERYQSNPWPQWTGVLHGDEIFFVFGEPFKCRDNFTDNERTLSRQMITYWTNFAKTGSARSITAFDLTFFHLIVITIIISALMLVWTA